MLLGFGKMENLDWFEILTLIAVGLVIHSPILLTALGFWS